MTYSLLLAKDIPLKFATCSESTPLARHQNLKTFPHAGRRYQVLELQRDFGALLGQAAFFEGVRKLIRLSDSHQKL